MGALDFNTNSFFGSGGRIVGGTEVRPPFAYPWIVSLQRGGSHSCGGSLIKGNKVITAAHCTIGNDGDWKVKVHRHNLKKSDGDEGGATFNIVKRVAHPNYQNDDAFDIAVWTIDSPSTEHTSLILDDGSYGVQTGTKLVAIGWGNLTPIGPSPDTLQEVAVPEYDNGRCSTAYSFTSGKSISPKTQICAGYARGLQDTCQGDSGGPLILNRNGQHILVGATSFGFGCATPAFPGVYARVSGLRDFIDANI
ncbi:trypsin-like serine protease [Conidiobolus coronatus NRRL 28638]|uniref:Trypsin-like serine protease n=1 Tax=Conidiobolus coronatus (strain ATCC 28846 / CBS 209.66 / NRRL 28638) TaxID=796925 RepID=A0A137NU83_CONC2|nr:trypsin-like serine protease [Conidiobolus coronatus NRRL 28638]|eukprot:KXN66278.1 trypsin-like serine protease [Conidiobolus coronatus NRRL 28638]